MITEKNLSISYIDSRPAALYIAKQQPTAEGFNETVYVFYREYGSSGSYMSRVLPDDGIIDLKGLTRYSVFLRATNYYRHYDQFSHISDHETLEGGLQKIFNILSCFIIKYFGLFYQRFK